MLQSTRIIPSLKHSQPKEPFDFLTESRKLSPNLLILGFKSSTLVPETLLCFKRFRMVGTHSSWSEEGSVRNVHDSTPVSLELGPICSESQFDRILEEARELHRAVVMVWVAKWCRKCIYLKPKLEKLAAEYSPSGTRFYCVDVNDVPQKLVSRTGVTKMPTIQLWKDGEKQSEVIGGHKAHFVVNEFLRIYVQIRVKGFGEIIGGNLDMLPGGMMTTAVEDSLRGSNRNLQNDRLHSELQLMLRELRGQDFTDRERDLNMCSRSGSAPPTVEGSLNAVGSLFRNSELRESIGAGSTSNGVLSEDDIRLHPAYLSYYYSHENVNPRLPPPLLSKEDWRVAQRFQPGSPSFAGVEDLRRKSLVEDGGSSSLFSMQPGVSVQRPENEFIGPSKASARSFMRQNSAEWLRPTAGLGQRRKSFADILQAGLDHSTSLLSHLSRPASQNAISDTALGADFSNAHFGDLPNGGLSTSHAFASPVSSSLSRSSTLEAQIAGKSSFTGLPPLGGRICPIEKKINLVSAAQMGYSSSMTKLDNIATTLSNLKLSGNRIIEEDSLQSQLQQELDNKHELLSNMPNVYNQNLQRQYCDRPRPEKLGVSTNFSDFARTNELISHDNVSKMSYGSRTFPRRTSSSANLHGNMNSSALGDLDGSHFQSTNFAGVGNSSPVPALNSTPSSEVSSHHDAALDGHGNGGSISRGKIRDGPGLHFPDSHYAQYSQRPEYAMHNTANLSDHYSLRSPISSFDSNLLLQKAYLEAILAQQQQQYELSCAFNHAYHANSLRTHGIPFHDQSTNHPVGSGGQSMFHNGRVSRPTSACRNSFEGPIGPWNSDSYNTIDGKFSSTLLEDFKNNKTRAFELSDIVGHVVEFSNDQYGSRFIQQKLEIANVEEKSKIFHEIVPHARKLMTDVFGNYVIQKVFEHGTESQRKDLAGQLAGHVLHLSLQMYGCRVVQKALEVVDVDQQESLVSELDGSVMKCVRDQNGNHVIQKCIECIPQDRIQFIITPFYGQVVALSTHPYGCRVIQRVLEHCNDNKTQKIVMDEIMQSVCSLAQDQYGNYVIQHVLQHGKAHICSAIISKLAGQMVKMSQQKFASNVVEKCLTFGAPEERQLLVNEVLGSTDQNEPLQAMMKDPYGNYVVQKMLETCNEQSCELILSRIKVHLNTLKRYTYGKHIVNRVEKLVTAGERQIALSSS